MAYYYPEPSHTFSEYLLIPGYTSEECVPDRVSLRTPLTKYRKGVEEPAISLNIPMTSAIMQSVSNDSLAIARDANDMPLLQLGTKLLVRADSDFIAINLPGKPLVCEKRRALPGKILRAITSESRR